MKKRNYSLDFLKAICIIFVILAHSVPLEYQKYLMRPFTILQAVPVFLVITGYNFSRSSFVMEQRKHFVSLFRYVWLRIKKLLIPFTLLFVTEAAFMLVKYNYHLKALIKLYLEGGVGPGAYFVPVMIQALLILPILFRLTYKTPRLTVTFIFFLSLLLEYITLGLSDYWYRLLLIRYLFAVELGVFLALYKDKLKLIYLLPLAALSIAYIVSIDVVGVDFVLKRNWGSQNALAYFYALLVVFVVTNLRLEENKYFETVGQNTYYICLVQKNYFHYIDIFLPTINMFLNTALALFISIYLTIHVANKISKNNFNKYFNTVSNFLTVKKSSS